MLAASCVCLFALSGVAPAGEPPKAAAKPDAAAAANPDPKQLLQEVILDLLTNPNLKSAREFYGTPGDKALALQTDSPVAWPKGWHPKIPGYDIRFQSEKNWLLDFVYWHAPYGVEIYSYIHRRMPRLLGVSLDTRNLDPGRKYDDQICVTLFNIGGYGGESPVIGGCIVYYNLKREKGKWVVQYAGSFDP
jgi:hypothetical protein